MPPVLFHGIEPLRELAAKDRKRLDAMTPEVPF
jgi:hypothetical protein